VGAAARSQAHRAIDAGHAGAADPDSAAAIAFDEHPAFARQRRALRGHVALGRQAGADEPLGQRGVQAAGDGVFAQAVVAREEGAHFKRRVAPCRVRPHHANVQPGQHRPIGLERQHLLGAAQHHATPVRPVVAPAVRHDVAARHTQAASDQRHIRFVQWAAFDQRWRREGQPLAVALDLHQAHTTFLHHVFRLRHAAGFQPRVASAQRGVAGKRKFAPRAENAHAVVGPRSAALGRGRQHKGALRQVGPVREVLHGLGAEA
jgi:hypothetical protein